MECAFARARGLRTGIRRLVLARAGAVRTDAQPLRDKRAACSSDAAFPGMARNASHRIVNLYRAADSYVGALSLASAPLPRGKAVRIQRLPARSTHPMA